jgi:uncharacterized membrane protein
MRNSTARKTLALGALTGMRSMAGPAALAFQHGGMLKRVVGLLAASEMVADKTALVPDRIDAGPLAGRAVLGAVVGGIVCYEEDDNVWLGALLGASAAIVAAHLAYQARRRLPVSNAVGGMIEDAVVIGCGALFTSS